MKKIIFPIVKYLLLVLLYAVGLIELFTGCTNSQYSENKPLPAVLISGEPIPVGTIERIGPMTSGGVWQTPLGYAYVFGKERPDLFVIHGDWYPGLYLYPYKSTTQEGIPVFGDGIPVEPLFGKKPGTVFQDEDGIVHGLWLIDKDLVHTIFDIEHTRFEEIGRVTLNELVRNPQINRDDDDALAVIVNPDGSIEVILGLHDGAGYRPEGRRDKSWRPYDDKGKWRGAFNNCFLYAVPLQELLSGPVGELRQVSETRKEVLNSYKTLTMVNLGEGREQDVVGGSRFGNFRYYHSRSSNYPIFVSGHIVGPDGNLIRHPVIGAGPAAYPNYTTGLSDLIVAGEGGFYYYIFTGNFDDKGNPVFNLPVPVLKENSYLYGGTLPVPTVVDWTGNGVMDIIAGYSDGRILLHENMGTNELPAFQPGVPVVAGGREIYVQPGYSRSLQDPNESRWGYVSPTVADWNGDGLPDILMNDATSEHQVFMNRGKLGSPLLDHGIPLYVKGMELFGTWRVKPAVAKMGERMAYVILDGDDELHLYWRIDDYNLEDGGKLTLADGSYIRGNFLDAGGSGRAKLNLVDWNGNGKMDLVIGTPRHGSFPDPQRGLPQSLGLPGAAVLLMENVGSNDAPVFEFPKLMIFKGEPMFFGQHEIGVAVADFGNPEGYDLIVSRESGVHYFFSHGDIDFIHVP
jgi:hypothetical protein